MYRNFSFMTAIQVDTLRGLKYVFITWVLVVNTLAIYLNFQTLSTNRTSLVVFLAIIQIACHLINSKKNSSQQLSFIIQSFAFTGIIAVMSGIGSAVVFLGISPILIIQIIISSEYKVINFLYIALITVIFTFFVIVRNNFTFWLFFAEIYSLILLILFLFAKNYQKSLQKQIELRHANTELKMAYNQVDRLSANRERERISRELHDTLLQDMTSLSMQLDILTKLLAKGDTD